ncbi:hypothetical protein D3C76_1715350 [compost metagenome]
MPGDQVVIHAQLAVPIRYKIAIRGIKKKGKMVWLLNGLPVFEADDNENTPNVYETEWAADTYHWIKSGARIRTWGTINVY